MKTIFTLLKAACLVLVYSSSVFAQTTPIVR